MKFKKILSIIAATTISFALVACGTEGNNTSSSNEGKETKVTEEVRVIEHAMGTTEIKGDPEKIVILTNEGTEALLALGIKPVGAVQSWTGAPWYEHIKDEMDGVQNVGLESQVNLEAIAALEPDLIIGNKMRQEKIYDQLSQIAPTVFSETLRGEWKNNFEFYSKALGKQEEGKALINEFNERIKSISEEAGDKLQTEISIVRFMPGKTRIYLGNSFSGIILNEIGFARPESQRSDEFANEIGKERLKEADGDVIFYFTYDKGDGDGNAREEEWINDPLFKSLEAAKNGKVFKVSDVIWNTSGGIKSANMMLDDIQNFMKNEL